MEKSKWRYFVNLSATFISQGFTAVSLLILTPHFFHTLGADNYAVYGIILQWIAAAAMLDFGMNTGLLRRIIAEPEKTNTLINTQFFALIGISLICIPVAYFFFRMQPGIAGENKWLSLVLTCIVIGQNLLALFFDVLIQSANKIFLGKAIRIGKTILEFIFLYRMSYTGNIVWLLLASVVVNTLYIFTLYHYSGKEVNFTLGTRYFRWSVLKEHLYYSLWYFLAIVATILVFNAQSILLNLLVSAAVVAQYLLVNKFYEVLKIGMTNFTLVLFPSLVSIQHNNNWVQLKKLFLSVLLRVLGISIFVWVLQYFFGEKLFSLWSGQSNPDTLTLLNYYGVFILMIAVDSVSAIFLSALKLNKLQTIVALLQGVLSLLLAYWFIPKMGITGMALASMLALLCTNFIFNPLYLLYHIRIGLKSSKEAH